MAACNEHARTVLIKMADVLNIVLITGFKLRSWKIEVIRFPTKLCECPQVRRFDRHR